MKSKMVSILISLIMVTNIFGAITENVGEPSISSNGTVGLPPSNIPTPNPQIVSQSSSSLSGSGGLADSPWPMFQQNLRHTGLSPYNTSLNNGKIKWYFLTGGTIFSSCAIDSDGTIYIGSLDDNLYAINPNGTEKWNFTAGANVKSSPIISSDGTIYVGSDDDRLYALNSDGTEKWSYTTGASVGSSPAIGSDGTIYVGSDDNKLYAINPDGTEKWNFTTGNIIWSSPAIGLDGTILFGSLDNKLYAVNEDGTEKWNFIAGSWIGSSPAIGADGTIYVGSWDDKLYAINPDGTEKWSFITNDNIFSSPAIGSDGTIYVGSWDGNLYAINPDGSEKWSFLTNYYIDSSPTIGSDGTIYVGSNDFKLYAIKPDGTEKWNFTTDSNVRSSPVIGADGTIYVGSEDYNIYAIGTSTQPPTANAGPDQTVNEGDVVQFDGSNSTGSTGGGPPSVDPNVVALYHMNEGSGNSITDETNNQNHGSIHGTTWTSGGKFSNALSFDGVDDYVEVPDDPSLDITNEITIEAWVYPRSIDDGLYHRVVDKYYAGSGYALRIEPDGKFSLDVQGWLESDIAIPGNSWSYIVGVSDGTYSSLYLNGQLVKTGQVAYPSGSIEANNLPLRIGCWAGGAQSHFDGIIDEVVIWNKKLSSQEILAYYNSGKEHFTGSGGGPPGTIESYEWDFESDGIYDYQETSVSAPDGAFDGKTTHIYGDNGMFKVTLRVTDDGLNDTDTCNITVNNVAPIVDTLSAVTIDELESVTLTGHVTDPGSDDLTFTWDWHYAPWGDKTTKYYNDGMGPDPFPSPAINPRDITEDATCQYGDDGKFKVTLTVTDDDSGSTTVMTNVTVNNVAPLGTIQSITMDVEIGLRVAGRKYNNVSMALYEDGSPIGFVSIERMPGSPDDQMAWIPVSINFSKSYNATVTYTPEDPPNVGGNPVWIYIKSQNGSIKKIHHTFNVQQSKKRDSEHWNHVEPWEVDLNGHFVGLSFEITSHVTDPGSDDETLTYTYGSQTVMVTYQNNPLNPDPYPSPETNPVDIMDTTTLIYEGAGTVTVMVEDDDGELGITTLDI